MFTGAWSLRMRLAFSHRHIREPSEVNSRHLNGCKLPLESGQRRWVGWICRSGFRSMFARSLGRWLVTFAMVLNPFQRS
jgi:hypothetical protein